MKNNTFFSKKITLFPLIFIFVSCSPNKKTFNSAPISNDFDSVVPAVDKTKDLTLSDFYKSSNKDSSSLVHATPSIFSFETSIICGGKNSFQTISNDPTNNNNSSDIQNEISKIIKLLEGKNCNLDILKFSIHNDIYLPVNSGKKSKNNLPVLSLFISKEGKVTAAKNAVAYINKASRKEYFLNGASNVNNNLVLGISENQEQIEGNSFNFQTLKLKVSGSDSEFSVTNTLNTNSDDINFAYVLPSLNIPNLRVISEDSQNQSLAGKPNDVATAFQVDVTNSKNEKFQIHLKGINLGSCPDKVWPLNIAGKNPECGSSKTFKISYIPEENKDLPAGKYSGEVNIQGYKLGNPIISQNIIILIDINK